MSNEIEMYVQDKESTKNEIHFIINNVICWGKRCSLNTKEQLLTAGFEIHIPEDIYEEVVIPKLTELEEDEQQSEDENQTDIETNSAQLEGTGHEPVLNEGDEEKIEPQTVGFVQTQEDIGEVVNTDNEEIKTPAKELQEEFDSKIPSGDGEVDETL